MISLRVLRHPLHAGVDFIRRRHNHRRRLSVSLQTVCQGLRNVDHGPCQNLQAGYEILWVLASCAVAALRTLS